MELRRVRREEDAAAETLQQRTAARMAARAEAGPVRPAVDTVFRSQQTLSLGWIFLGWLLFFAAAGAGWMWQTGMLTRAPAREKLGSVRVTLTRARPASHLLFVR